MGLRPRLGPGETGSQANGVDEEMGQVATATFAATPAQTPTGSYPVVPSRLVSGDQPETGKCGRRRRGPLGGSFCGTALGVAIAESRDGRAVCRSGALHMRWGGRRVNIAIEEQARSGRCRVRALETASLPL